MNTCPKCNGDETIECPKCEGIGQLNNENLTVIEDTDCTRCKGSGEVNCPNCKGSGEI